MLLLESAINHDATQSNVKIVSDSARRRRQVAVPQATIARFGRVAASLGPNWHVEADLGSNIIRLLQGAPPIAKVTPDDQFARGLRIVP